jgi:hypothetical protein
MKSLMKHGYIASIYYKGTACPLHLHSEDQLNQITESAHAMIKEGLKHGDGLREQIEIYTEQLNQMENLLVQAKKKRRKACPLNEQELTLYWLNVLALTKLKAIPDNDMSGLLVTAKC